ncbi:riboflavin synthase subunit beta [Tenacibaculum sp. 1B UA]|uniref:riboflavin synthase subunit beta n=1 Tax=unclassified Tenacibaculum TaxID=2635139 RepID=UPI0026E2151F|nr:MULTISPECIES: riboflavin synthase subunit beta [unclassified Tenacibaculum]MDO6674740.1 riboflavin synthase subunit beta [Tenacibaculum sp. 1_MG-2023]MDX8554936.1 riboflavin synthase subunit beta [Tenacibaculum sp. 1B UA]
MGFIKKENKKFDYKPRYYKGDGNPYEIKQKFDQYRTTIGKKKGLKGKFNAAIDEFKGSGYKLNKTIVVIALVLTLIFLFIIDFDLSIFFSKNN